jgi:cytochrome c peroxidase
MKTLSWQKFAMATSVLVACGLLGWLAWPYLFASPDTPHFESPLSLPAAGVEPISPIPVSVALDDRKVALGRRLFHDTRFSRNNTVACVNCHRLELGGTDRSARSVGIDGQKGGINAPSVFNSGFNFRQFWDGRAASLEEQVNGPVNHPLELGSNWLEVVGKLKADAGYAADFAKLYRDGIQPANIRDAIATFERSLITPNSRFDKFLRGNQSAITPREKEGYRLFKNYGCVTCHQGVNIGGNMYEKFGAMGDYFKERGNITQADLGRFNLTRQPEHRFEFKVPSLRNVALTPPYFHDASAQTLEQAIRMMGKYQLGVEIPAHDNALIEAFLRTLNGEYNGKPL